MNGTQIFISTHFIFQLTVGIAVLMFYPKFILAPILKGQSYLSIGHGIARSGV